MIVKGVAQIACRSYRDAPCVPLVTAVLTRTLSCFTCLPGGSLLGTVSAAPWRCCAARRLPAGGVVPRGGYPPRRGSHTGYPGGRRRSRGPAPRFRNPAKPEPALARHAPWKGSVGLLHVRGAGVASQVHAVVWRRSRTK
jgi:hypothetical protein